MPKQLSKLEQSVILYSEALLRGTVLAIDPSSGSTNSRPGYALFKAGKFIDGGILTLKVHSKLNSRLFDLGKTLREEFETPDVLVTENIAPIGVNTGIRASSLTSLQKSIGVVISSFECPLVEVAPISWRKYIPATYVKRDDNDALMMAYTAIRTAQVLANEPLIELKDIEPYLLTSFGGEAF